MRKSEWINKNEINEKMYTADNNCDNDNDGDEKVFLTLLIS